MKRAWLMAGVLGMVLSMTACRGVIVNAGDSLGGAGGEGGAAGTGESHPTAVAMRFSQWTPVSSPTSLFQLNDTSGPVDPDALMIFFASEAQACSQPFISVDEPAMDPATCAEQAFWQTILIVPPDLVQPGVIDTSNPDLFVYRGVWLPECGGGSGSTPGVDGSLTIKSIGASSIDVTLDVMPITGEVTAQNGDYTATFCH